MLTNVLRIFIKLLTYILVGAGYTETLISWVKQRTLGLGDLDERSKWWLSNWKACILSGTLEALYLWDLENSLDTAINYFTAVDNFRILKKRRRQIDLQYIPMSLAFFFLNKQMQDRRAEVSPESYDKFYRTAFAINFSNLDLREFNKVCHTIFHPTHPTADFLMPLLRRVRCDPSHAFRLQLTKKGGRDAQQKFVFYLAYEARKILRREGRHEDANWVFATVEELWGRKSGFLQGVSQGDVKWEDRSKPDGGHIGKDV